MNNVGTYHPGAGRRAHLPRLQRHHTGTLAGAEAAKPYLTTHFGNPSSGHAYAERLHRALAQARQQLAAHQARTELDAGGADRIRILRDLLYRRLDKLLPGRVQLNGHRDLRLPNTLNVSITGVTGDDLLAASPGITAATGAGCHTGIPEPSPVLLAMGLDPRRARSALRLTLGRWTTRDDIEQAAQHVAAGAPVAHSSAIP